MKGKVLWGVTGVLVLVAGAIRAVNLDWGVPEVFEEATPVREAVGFWGVPSESIDLNPHFFKYPSLTFYLNFLAQSVWYFWLSLTGQVGSLNEFRQILDQNVTQVVRLGRSLQAALGALIVIPTVLLGRKLGGDLAAVGAGALIAVLPAAVLESQLVGPDVALTLFSVCALVSATAIAEHGRRSDYLWCGVWIGLATASKYPGALLVAALLTAHFVRMKSESRSPAMLVASGILWQALITSGVVFFATSPYVLLDLSTALEDIGFERRHMALGHLGREGGRAWTYYLQQAIPSGWTMLVSILAVLGMGGLLVDGKVRRKALPGIVFGLLTLAVLGSWRMAAARYVLPLAPLGAAWAGFFLATIPGRFGIPDRARIPAGTVLIVAVLVWPALSSRGDIRVRGRQDSRIAAGEWISRNVAEGSSILVERYGPTPDPDRFKVLFLPFHGVTPHLYDGAYLPWLYRGFDYIVLSSGVHGRYLSNPREYPHQLVFYRAVDLRLDEVASFSPGRYLGPEVRILKRSQESWSPNLEVPEGYFALYKGNSPLAEYFSALGTVLVRQGNEEEGFAILQEAVDMDPENPKAWGNLGAMRLRVGLIEEALAAFRHAQEGDPEDPDLWLNLGVLYAQLNEYGQSADAYRRAIQYAPEVEEAYLGLARALVADDRYAEARVVLREFKIRFPRSPRRASAEEALDQLLRMGPGKP